MPYNTNQKTLKKTFVHLTNYSINKKGENYVKNTNEGPKDENEITSKWSFKQLRDEYQKMGINYNEIFK